MVLTKLEVMKSINPNKYNLSIRTKLLQNAKGSLFIVVDRKTRLVMKDGYRILASARKKNKKSENKKISVLTSAPVCSKTKEFLLKNKIKIEFLKS